MIYVIPEPITIDDGIVRGGTVIPFWNTGERDLRHQILNNIVEGGISLKYRVSEMPIIHRWTKLEMESRKIEFILDESLPEKYTADEYRVVRLR